MSEERLLDSSPNNIPRLLRLLRSPRCSPAYLRVLAQNINSTIQQEVARHPDTPVSVLEQLATVGHWRVTDALINNPAVPPQILYDICTRETTFLQRKALHLLETRPDVPEHLRTAVALVL